LILALIYIVVISLVVAALTSWATNDINNSSKFQSADSLGIAASGMTEVAIQYVRYNPLISTSQQEGTASPLVACWGSDSISQIPSIDGSQIAVWCSTVWNPLLQATRVVTFYACPISVSAASCAQSGNTLLTATVNFDDYPPPPAVSAPIQVLCTVWCGEGMTIVNWVWGSSVSGGVTGIASSLSFSSEPSDTTVGAATTASVTVLDSVGNPVAGDPVTISEQSGPDPLDGSSTLIATTNPSGIATFTNLIPDDVGNYVLSASDTANGSTASPASSTYFVVSQGSNVISVSTPPSNATVNGVTYQPIATATSNDTVAIASTTTVVCTLSGGQVSFLTAGTCTLSFSDPGNANYVVATTTQSFTVTGSAATQVGITPNSASPSADSVTNDSLTLQLQNAVGVSEKSSGTTTLVVSDAGNGFFAAGSGVAGTSTLTVSFTNGVGVQTIYFGNETSGSDAITALNGTSTWGTAPLTVQAGSAVGAIITPNTSTPQASGTTNDQLSLQLEDSYGNHVTSSGTTTLTLSDAGIGFFAASNGVAGTATLNVQFSTGVGTATAYFGNTTAGSDLVTATNGSTSWGSTSLTIQAGTATKVGITVSPTAPAKSASTNATVTIQLEDQYGNSVSTSGVTFVLGDSGVGFFATSSGTSSASSTATLNVTTNSSGVAVGYFGDNTDSSDTITATQGATTWGSTTFSV
jgi:hypothetical protein